MSGKFIVLRVGEAVQSESKTERDCHLVTDTDLLDILQNVKMPLLQGLQRFFAQDDQIFVFFDLAAQAVDRADILVYFPVDQGCKQSFAHLLDRINNFVVVVDIEQTDRKTLVIHFLDSQPHRRIINKTQGDNISACPIPEQICAGDQMRCGDPAHLGAVAAPYKFHSNLHLLFICRKNIPGKARNQG